MYHYEGDDEAAMDPQQDYKVFFFNRILDCAINAVEERFSQLQVHRDIFGVLYDISSIKEKNTSDILQECTALEKALTPSESGDVDGQELFAELTALSRRLAAGTTPLDALKTQLSKTMGWNQFFPMLL